MFGFFRRRKPAPLSILQRETVPSVVTSAEPSSSQPAHEEPLVVEAKPDPASPVLATPRESQAHSTPAEFAPANPAVKNLYAILNSDAAFAAHEKTSQEMIAESSGNFEPSSSSNLSDEVVSPERDAARGSSARTGEVRLTDEPPVTEFSRKQTDPETADTTEFRVPAVADPERAAEPVAEVASVDAAPAEVTKLESSVSEHAAPDPAHRLAELENAVRQQVSAAPPKRKSKWWDFGRKARSVAEPSITKDAPSATTPATDSAAENPVEIVAPEQETSRQASLVGPWEADPLQDDAVVTYPSNSEGKAPESQRLEIQAAEVVEVELPAGAEATFESSESQPIAEPSPQLKPIEGEPEATEPKPEMVHTPEAAVEVHVPEDAGAEVVLTTEQSGAAANRSIEPSADETESATVRDLPAATESPGVDAVVSGAIAEAPLTEADASETTLSDPIARATEAVPDESHAATPRPKRRWWSFWRKRGAAEKRSALPSMFESLTTSTLNQKSASEPVAAEEEVAANPVPAAESDGLDLGSLETAASESSSAEISDEIAQSGSDVPKDSNASGQVDLLELFDLSATEAVEAQSQPGAISVAGDSTEVATPATQADETTSAVNPPTVEEFDELEKREIESEVHPSEPLALSLDMAPIEQAATESVPVLTLPAMALSDETSSSDVPQDTTTESESPAVAEEPALARITVGEQSQQTPSGSGLLDLPRVAEPEVMDESKEVEAYASATAQAWLDKIDDSFVDHAARLVSGWQRGRALDIGTGPGQIALKLALRLSLWTIIGVDRSQKMIDEALAKLAATAPVTGRLEFQVADGNRLDFPNATFDLVICNSVLHHFAEPRNLLSELARVTKPRGAILLRDLRRPSRLEYPFHVRWHGRHYDGTMGKLYRDSVRAAYTIPELQKLLDASPLRGARVFRHGSTHIGVERPYNW